MPTVGRDKKSGRFIPVARALKKLGEATIEMFIRGKK